jgi:phosphoserine aminotransferase
MISFYPGPSRVHDEIPKYVKDAFDIGMLSLNHRSKEFMDMCEKTVSLLKKKLHIPDEYTIFFTGSATECWEVIAQSLVEKNSFHIFNGAFGQKWYEYTKRIAQGVKQFPFEPEEILNTKKYNFSNNGVICITQNETSNGTQVACEIIREIKSQNPKHIVAVDATSSMAGIILNFEAADIWFASVQKCFGLPAGLAIMICSPQAMNSVAAINENKHYNSLTFMAEMMEKYQTPFTPNVLAIYLLMRVMKATPAIEKTHKKIIKRYNKWIDFLEARSRLSHYIKNKEAHSYTVIPVTTATENVEVVKKHAQKNGFLLGEGYGQLKSSTFRIANFPALTKEEITKLKKNLKRF